MGGLKVEKPAADFPLSVDVVKNHLRVDLNDDDDLIEIYLGAATEKVENATGRSLVNKVYRQTLDGFPHRHNVWDVGLAAAEIDERWHDPNQSWNDTQRIKLLRSPLVRVLSITYVGQDQLPHILQPTPDIWQPSTEYVLGDQRIDTNGNLQEVTAIDESQEAKDGSVSSGASVPAWNITVSGTTADAALTWTNRDVAPAGDFLVDADGEPPRIFPPYGDRWPDDCIHVPNAVTTRFVAGYGNDGTDVPDCAKVAIMQLVGNWYENREATTSLDLKAIPYHLLDLLWSIKVVDFAPTRG